jgi:tRNA 2-thiouridine synthesizing protein A
MVQGDRSDEGVNLALKKLDTRGLKCPMPVLKLTQVVMKKEVVPGDQIEVTADCPTFEADVRQWCAQMKKVLVRVTTEGQSKTALIQL